MTNNKFFKHFAYSFYDNGGEYPDTEHFECPECGALVEYHGDDMNLPVGEEYWECTSCGFKFMISDIEEYEYYYDELKCPICGEALNAYYQRGTGQPKRWECEYCETNWIEDDDGDLVQE